MNINKLVHMTLHIPCVLLLTLQEYWWLYKDNITQLCGRLVRNIKSFIFKGFKFILYLAVSAPIAMVLMILTIKLS